MEADWPKGYKMGRRHLVTVLDKLIIQDLLKTMLSVLMVIVVIIVSRKFIRILDDAIAGQVSNETLLSILGLKTIVASVEFLPVALFMAVLMVLGRMYRDQEMSAISSAGGGARNHLSSRISAGVPLKRAGPGFVYVCSALGGSASGQAHATGRGIRRPERHRSGKV